MALLIFYSIALLGLAQQQVTTSNLTIIPKSDGSATGCVDLRELSANGVNKACLKAADNIYANRVVTMPNYTTTLIGDQNYAYGSTFAITGTRANGTEASPTDVIAGNVLFQFLGKARTGGVDTYAAGLDFFVDTASPLKTYATIELSNSGVFGTAYAFEIGRFYSVNTPDLGISFFRFGNVYAQTADFSIPGTADTSWVSTQNFQILDNAGGTGFWRFKGFANATNKYMWLEDPDGARFWECDLVFLGVTGRTCNVKADWTPKIDNTYDNGTASFRWRALRAVSGYFTDADFTGTAFANVFDTIGTSPEYRIGGAQIVDGSRNATFANLTISGTCTGCPSGTGAAPLGEVKITDYGATSNCTTPTTVRTALASALAALPTDTAGKKSGIVTFPAGCYGWDIANGSLLLDRAGATPIGDVWLVGAGGGSEFAAVGAGTEIRAIGSAPASATAMVEFRTILGGGIRNIQLNAAGISNTRILKIRESRFGHYENVQGRRWTSGPGLEFSAESGATAGSCHNNFIGLHLGDVKNSDQASGILFDGIYLTGPTRIYSACSNKFTHGTVIYSKSGSATYGIKWALADNNTLDRVNVWASDCTAYPCESNGGTSRTNGTMPALTMAQNSNDPTFPKENFFDGTLTAGNGYLITGVSGTSGNRINHTLDDCGGLLVGCIATTIPNIQGATSYGLWLPKAIFPHLDAYQGTMTLGQSNGGLNSGGRLNLSRQDRVLAAVGADFSTGLVFSVGQPSACNLHATVGSRSPHVTANSLSNIFVSGGVAIASTASAHGCAIGDRIRVSESTVASLTGEFTITNVPSSTQLQWNTSAANGTYSSDGLTVQIAPIPWWQIGPSGTLTTTADGIATLGAINNKPSIIWAQAFRTYTSNAFGAQASTLLGDNDVNLNMDAYGSSGSNYRAAINFRRGRLTSSSPVAVAASDRLGVLAWWGYVSGGFAVGSKIESYATVVSGANLSADLHFYTVNAGSGGDRMVIAADGATTISGITTATTFDTTGATAYRVSGNVFVDSTRNLTISGISLTANNTYSWGSIGTHPATVHATNFDSYGSFAVIDGGSISRGIMDTSGLFTFDSGGSTTFQVINSTGATTASGTIRSNTGFNTNGNTGLTSSFTCGTGLAVKSMNVQGGIVVSVTCGTP